MRSERLADLRLVRQHVQPTQSEGGQLAQRGQAGQVSAQWVRCEQVTHQLPGILDGDDEAHPDVIYHVEHCLACQAELAQYRRLLRALHQLRVVVVEPPPGLLSEVVAQLGEAAERGAIRSALAGHRLAYLATLAAAAGAAGVAGVAVVLASRGRSSAAKMPLAS